MLLRPVEINLDMIGSPLPWDIFDQNGTFLMPQGAKIASSEQLEKLQARKLYINVEGSAVSIGHVGPSPIDKLDDAQQKLETLLPRMLLTPGSPETLLAQAAVVRDACETDPDAALGWTRLNRRGRHSVRHVMHVAMVSHLLTWEQFGAGEGDHLSLIAAALTMNVGAMDLHDQLASHGGSLSTSQKEAIRLHPQRSAAILNACGIKDNIWVEAVRQHHETTDGSGYPHNLSGGDIHPYSKVLMVADIYCARLGNPYYRFPLRRNAVHETFGRQRKNVDAILAGSVFRQIGMYHPGLLVRLVNHELGVIVRRSGGGTPGVQAIVGAHGEIFESPQPRDTRHRQFGVHSCVAYDEIRPKLDLNRLWGYASSLN